MIARLWLAASALILAVFSGPGVLAQTKPLSFPDRIDQVRPSVVGVGSYNPLRQPRTSLSGTGFAVADGLHILTNEHVVSAVDGELVVLVGRGARFERRKAQVLEVSEHHDMALVKLLGGAPLPAMTLSSGTTLAREGEDIAVTGFPIGPVLGLYPATHRGIVSAITPSKTPVANARLLSAEAIVRRRYNVYQLDLTVYPGNSGSPLYRLDTGQVVGVLNSTFVKSTRESALTDPTGISFAIPIRYGVRMLRRAGLQP